MIILTLLASGGIAILIPNDLDVELAHFGSQENLWSGRVRLMVITVVVES